MSSFLQCIESAQLHSVSQKGSFFTWSNDRKDDWLVMEKLDRALANISWLQVFPFSHTQSLGTAALDHSLSIFNSQFELKTMKQKKFEDFWYLSKECDVIIQQSWNKKDRGSPNSSLICKLRRSIDALSDWSKLNVRNLAFKIKELESKLVSLSASISSLTPLFDHILKELSETKHQLEFL